MLFRSQLADIRRLGELLRRARGRIDYRRLDRISPLAVPVLLEIGKERVLDGSAEDELLDIAAQELIEAYGFLRRVEHRLQMIDDRQTHSIPEDSGGVAALATFLGYEGAPAFEQAMLRTLRTVEGHYARLFEEAPSLAGPGGNLVFTGTDDDPGTLETLRGLGFTDPSAAAGIVRRWHHGRFRATTSARARELLTELMPALLKAR